MKTCYIYARTATDTISDKGTSLERQIAECQKYAEKYDIKVLEIFAETASGVDFKRKELQRLLRACENNPTDAVLIIDTDRLSRGVKDFAKIYQILRNQNIQLISTRIGNLSESSSGSLLGFIDAAIAQFELERSREK